MLVGLGVETVSESGVVIELDVGLLLQPLLSILSELDGLIWGEALGLYVFLWLLFRHVPGVLSYHGCGVERATSSILALNVNWL